MPVRPCAPGCECRKHRKHECFSGCRQHPVGVTKKKCPEGCTCKRHSSGALRGPRISAAKKGVAVTHGFGRHSLYPTWRNMMSRCYKPDHVQYEDWGGRGITVFEEWHRPDVYITWVLENLGPRLDGMTIDRIDNDAGYEPGNIRWATRSQQNLNRRPSARVGDQD